MDETLAALHVNAERFRADFEALAEIGSTGDGGVHRPALGEAHLAAREGFRRRSTEAGLEFRTDQAGNHSAFLACGPAGAPTLLLGSHLDSVPHGGRFDGALGVLAALEVLRTVKEAGVSLPVQLEAMDFTDEEGTLVGMLGSAALAGILQPEALQDPRGGRAALEDGLARAGLSEAGLLMATCGGRLPPQSVRDNRTLSKWICWPPPIRRTSSDAPASPAVVVVLAVEVANAPLPGLAEESLARDTPPTHNSMA